jgi:hypothetical protein
MNILYFQKYNNNIWIVFSLLYFGYLGFWGFGVSFIFLCIVW